MNDLLPVLEIDGGLFRVVAGAERAVVFETDAGYALSLDSEEAVDELIYWLKQAKKVLR